MSRLTPRGNTDADREILMTVTGRTSRDIVHDNTSHAVRNERHDWQDSIAAWAVENAPARHVGCTSNCADQGECDCSHSYSGPRQPRRPEPRTPHLPLWTRYTLWAQGRMAFYGDWRDLMAVVGILAAMGVAMVVAAALLLLS